MIGTGHLRGYAENTGDNLRLLCGKIRERHSPLACAGWRMSKRAPGFMACRDSRTPNVARPTSV